MGILFIIPIFILAAQQAVIKKQTKKINYLSDLNLHKDKAIAALEIKCDNLTVTGKDTHSTDEKIPCVISAVKALILSQHKECGLREVYLKQNTADKLVITARMDNPGIFLQNGGVVIKKVSAVIANTFDYVGTGKVVIVNIDFEGKWQQNNREKSLNSSEKIQMQ